MGSNPAGCTKRKMENKHTSTISLKIPKHVEHVAQVLMDAGFDSYLVGGCVRDLLIGREVNDWDYTTSAKPEQIESLFPHTVYENNYGTVAVVFDEIENEKEKIIEITPYRTESNYDDNRRPSTVNFEATLSEDLTRRDFTINALAYNPITKELIDEHGGVGDLHERIIKTVGDPQKRFNEDALRLMRAVRIANNLECNIEEKTKKAIIKNSDSLNNIAEERIRDEFTKIMSSKKPMVGILLLHELNLLKNIIPELLTGIGIEQNQAHSFDVFEHNLRTLEHAGVKNLSLLLRLAALFHDISKPETREWSDKNKDWTFYNHEIVGARVAKKVLGRLKYSKETIDSVTLLVRWHMFFSDTEQISLAGVRRMLARVGEEKMWELIDLRMCDRIGTGRPKEQPYRLRKYISLVEEVLRDPITPGTLVVKGDDLKSIGIEPGPSMGNIIHILLSEVLDDPTKNTKENLLERAKELSNLPKDELQKLGKKGKIHRFEEEEKEIKAIQKKYGVS